MKKLLFLTMFLTFGIWSCKKDSGNSDDKGYHCHNCTITQHWIKTGQIKTTTSVDCGIQSDVDANEAANTHSDSTLVQTCNCVDQ